MMPNNNMDDMLPFHGLRGVCAMAIFLGHQTEMFLAAPLLMSASFTQNKNQTVLVGLEYLQAISLFFLLSGIPLVRLYSRKVQTWQGTRQFWRKRWARLAPIYYLTLLLNLLVIAIICQQVDIHYTLQSFLGCAFFLQSWFVSWINVGGVLWQVAVFVFGYALFPVLSRWMSTWTKAYWLVGGIFVNWLLSAGLWVVVSEIVYASQARIMGWWIWHVHCLSRLPHVFAGVLLGELVERKRREIAGSHANYYWALVTDLLSLVLLVTAVQAPIMQWYYGTEVRSAVSIGLEAWLLPIHAVWLAGMVLAYQPPGDLESQHSVSSTSDTKSDIHRECWTRHVLSLKPLIVLGDLSLVLYCIHLVVMFLYTSAYAYITTGDWHIVPAVDDYTLRVQLPWWHAPILWMLVIAASFVVSKGFEAPLRRMLSPGSMEHSLETNKSAGVSEATALLLPSVSDGVAYMVESSKSASRHSEN